MTASILDAGEIAIIAETPLAMSDTLNLAAGDTVEIQVVSNPSGAGDTVDIYGDATYGNQYTFFTMTLLG
jgi:hypothetical protein